MLRLLRTSKWVGLTLAALVVILAFGAMSWWQWQRAQRDRVDLPAVPAAEAFTSPDSLPESSYGTRVELTGTYDAQHQTLVAHGPQSYWVITPLRPSNGPAVAIARGSVTDPSDPRVAAIPAGTVTVVGRAQPFEGDPGSSSTPLPDGQIERLTAPGLALPYAAAPGWIALETQDPASDLTPVVAPVGVESTAGIRLQNASYAVQWVLFAGFVVFLWWRMLRDDLREERSVLTGGDGAAVGLDRKDTASPSGEPLRDIY